VLKALAVVATGTHLCGSSSCLAVLEEFTNSKGFVWMCLVACTALYAMAWVLQTMIHNRQRSHCNQHYSGMPRGAWADKHITELQYLNDEYDPEESSYLRHRRAAVGNSYNSDILRLM